MIIRAEHATTRPQSLRAARPGARVARGLRRKRQQDRRHGRRRGDHAAAARLGGRALPLRSSARGEGLPDEGGAGFKPLRNRLLGLLVYRIELRQAADRLGVEVTENQVSKRLPTASGGEQEVDSGGDTFPRDSVVAQLLYEQIFDKVTRDVRGPSQAELSARRNEAMAAFVTRLQRETKVRYEPGYAPSP